MNQNKNIAVLGAGKMGLGITQLFASKGYPVKVIYVFDDKKRGNALDILKTNLSVLCENNVIKEQDISDILGRITFTEDMEEAAKSADIIFECILEDLKVKQDYFATLDKLCPENTILASNTSAISITEIAEKAVHKERIIGTHYWNPAYLIPLVEVIKTKYVSDETVKATCKLLEDAGKKPVVVKKDVPGFLANRMQHALFREALSIVENGIADPSDVDDAIKYGFGMRLGVSAPMEVMDMGGLDLTYSIHQYLFPHLEDSHEPLKYLTDKMNKGELGFKTGKGLQEWSSDKIEQTQKNLTEGLIKVAKALDRL
ncbi:3-hydroxyacyl-CoA dehydrogenase family protein [Aminipila luticellarii]|uniref:3-hydroxybutyryl-CoA dehydrogenase n=1 Tax=Aminipila luticellarii TaxID=2507160 RepID=A0A410PS65_9FIRM|nr:3-hydroxyacyl-CoA dehydrogenase NAD-binding domain-containing protein [Aminipila luticellarii]QAT41753.1 3-hydroxyacyl-CoA dehydrogenase family protein [Aminipila luticellarii]